MNTDKTATGFTLFVKEAFKTQQMIKPTGSLRVNTTCHCAAWS